MPLNIDSLQRFLARFPDTDTWNSDQPRTIFPSAYDLTRRQEDNLMAEAQRRLEELKGDLGWNRVREDGWWGTLSPAVQHQSNPAYTFFGKRDLAALMAVGNVDWRPNVFGGLFCQSNLHIPLTRKLTRQMASRTKNYFFGSEPWFALLGRFTRDMQPAVQANHVAQWQFERAKAVTALNHACDQAFVMGEHLVKVMWKDLRRYYRQFAEVAYYGRQPLMAADDDYIYREDLWNEEPDGMLSLLRPGLPEPFLLSRDDQTQIQFVHRPVMRERIVYRGLELQNKLPKDVLISPTAKSVEEARDVIDLFDEPRTALATRYLAHAAKYGETENMPNVLRLLRGLSSSDEFHSSAARPRPELNEMASAENGTLGQFGSLSGDNCQFAEHWMEVDADEDGYAEKIVLLYEVNTGFPIAYDYVDNVRPKGSNPFACVRINPVPGRWHGVGQVEIFWQLQNAIDLMFNRINFSCSREGRIDVIKKSAFANLDREQLLPLNGGETLELKEAEELEKVFKQVYLSDSVRVDHLFQIMQFLQQAFISLAGGVGPQDADMSGLPTSKTATGLRLIDRETAETFNPLIGDIVAGLEEVVDKGVQMFGANLDDGTIYKYFEGEAKRFAEFKQQNFNALEYDVEIRLTRYRSEQELLQCQGVIESGKDFVAQLPEFRAAMAYYYRRIMELYQSKVAEQTIAQLAAIPPMLPPAGPNPNPTSTQALVDKSHSMPGLLDMPVNQ